MAYLAAQTYRVTDPIENLRLCVTLRKRATEGERKLKTEEAIKPARRLKRPSLTRRASDAAGSDDEDGEAENDRDADDADGSETKPLRVEREEEEELLCEPRIFRWQEKAFSREEVRQIRKAEDPNRGRRNSLTRMAGEISQSMRSMGQGTATTLSNHHRAELERLDRSEREMGRGPYEGETIYTRVHSERFATEWTSKFTDSAAEAPTPLARAVMEGIYMRAHRDVLGEAACVSMHVLATLPLGKEDETKPERRSSLAGLGSAISASSRSLLGAEQPAERTEEEVILCELRLYPQGRLDIRPPLSYDHDSTAATGTLDEGAPALARWYAVPGTRFEYKLDNLAEERGWESRDKPEALAEQIAKLSTAASGAPGRAMSDLDFDRPPPKVARVYYFVTLESASQFGADALYVAYYALAAPGWKLLPHCTASAVTQTSYVRASDERAVLSFPMELALESDGPPTSARPPLSLFFSVVSSDVHERLTQLGYAHIAPPGEAGMSTVDVQAWALAEERTDALRRFFIGGSEELADLRAIALPDGFDISTQPQCLNKHGLQTVTSGTLHLKVQTIVQQHQPPTPKGPVRALPAAARTTFQRSPPDFSALRGAAMVTSLANTPTAVDRVFKRLEERRRTEGKVSS